MSTDSLIMQQFQPYRFQLAMTGSLRYNGSVLLILPPFLVTPGYKTSVCLAICGDVDVSAEGTNVQVLDSDLL